MRSGFFTLKINCEFFNIPVMYIYVLLNANILAL